MAQSGIGHHHMYSFLLCIIFVTRPSSAHTCHPADLAPAVSQLPDQATTAMPSRALSRRGWRSPGCGAARHGAVAATRCHQAGDM